MGQSSTMFTKIVVAIRSVMALPPSTYDDHNIHPETLSRASGGQERAISALDVVCVSTEYLRELVADAVREGIHQLDRPRVEPDAVVSLDQAAKHLRRRRSVVLQLVMAGAIPAELVQLGKRKLWRIRVADLKQLGPAKLAAIGGRDHQGARAGGR